ncbi:TrmH family RNA methyltransferase [Rhizobium oryzicola]|uniref:RNA methyltransferase n=1 Tax=Rhizobium oryzicola TaxID=1232668 RepID=A0ABT8SUL9_9HYPH|nr:RNA methyltransferase [Rhizobium oryzicola]MDO1582130.1 RNA methyltransferase [Rhizobium oryzicola]
MSLPQPILITDADDPRIAEFRNIRERDLVGRQAGFIAEGTVVLRLLAAAHNRLNPSFVAEKILLLENRVDGVSDILKLFPEDVPVYVASAAVLDAIAGFHLHRGVLALGRRVTMPTAQDLLRNVSAPGLIAIACGISNHDNIGSMFRNAAAFGAAAVLLDETCCDPLYRKALRVSVGSVLTVPFARGGTADDLLRTVAGEGFDIWALSPRGTADVRDIPAGGRIALVTGTEGTGLPQDILSRFRTASIPQRPGLDSLNAATATGIALYEIARRQGLV